MTTIFRPYHPSSGERSDRSAGDRLRHREKIRDSIRENIADIIAEESIIGKERDRIIKVPIRGIREYRFVFGDNSPQVGQGGEDARRGQVVGKMKQGAGAGPAGDQPGVDYYETDVSLDELVTLMFEDLELPDMEKKQLRELEVETQSRRKGYRRKGIRVQLDKRRTARSRIKRILAIERRGDAAPERFPFHTEDLRYHHRVMDARPQSNAVVFCIMDTSGSMDTMKKYLARSFFFLLYQFLLTKYQKVETVFIAHHTEAREVTEEEFFKKGESGGTFISSGYVKSLEIIGQRYHPSLWNIYAFHCSDGDNFDSDNAATLRAARELVQVANLVGYGEIKPLGSGYYGSSMIRFFSQIASDNFHTIQIQRKEDIWPSFKAFLSRDRIRTASTQPG